MAVPGGGPSDRDEDIFEQELELTVGDERLPWLESDDELEQPGVDTGRVAAIALLGLMTVVLVGGALWYFLRDDSAGALVADGSVIEAPDEPYRTRPEDPGGQQVAGTGNASFQVAEGKQVEGQIATAPAPPPTTAAEDEPESPPPVPDGSIGVQVGAYNSRAAAEAGWSTLTGRLEPLQGRSHRVVEGMADIGRVYRLQALAGSVAEAQTLCQSIKAAGGDCQVKR
jgi:hypothetical protein